MAIDRPTMNSTAPTATKTPFTIRAYRAFACVFRGGRTLLRTPPALAAAGDLAKSEQNCSDAQPQLTVYHDSARTKTVKRGHKRHAKKHKAKRRKHRRSARAKGSPRFTG